MTPLGAPAAVLRSLFPHETPDPALGKGRRLTGILHQRPTGPTSGTVFGQHAYQYDALGRLWNWQKWVDAAQSKWANIQHDDEDQLTDIEERDGGDALRGTFGFRYDAAGNRTTSDRWTVATGTVNRVWSANGLNQLTVQTTGPESGPAIPYDADGNMLSALRPPNSASAASTFTYEWDAENRLVAVNYGGGKRVAWTYDALHRRAKQTDTVAGIAKVRDLIWDGLRLIECRDQGAGEIRRYYGNGEERFLVATPLVVTRLFYTRDHLGSIREVVDATGAIRARYDYTPFGERIKLSGDLDCDFGFTGHYTHEATGLVAAPYRLYDPLLGRWLSRDPIEEEGGINLYGYVGNGPVNAVDPLGLTDTILDPLMHNVVEPVVNGTWNAMFGEDGLLQGAKAGLVETPTALLQQCGLSKGAAEVVMAAAPTPVGKVKAVVQGGRVVGSYWLKFTNEMSYFGKGTIRKGYNRMKISAARIKKETGATVDWAKSKFYPAKGNCPNEALRNETRMLLQDGGPKSPTNFNKIWPPSPK